MGGCLSKRLGGASGQDAGKIRPQRLSLGDTREDEEEAVTNVAELEKLRADDGPGDAGKEREEAETTLASSNDAASESQADAKNPIELQSTVTELSQEQGDDAGSHESSDSAEETSQPQNRTSDPPTTLAEIALALQAEDGFKREP